MKFYHLLEVDNITADAKPKSARREPGSVAHVLRRAPRVDAVGYYSAVVSSMMPSQSSSMPLTTSVAPGYAVRS